MPDRKSPPPDRSGRQGLVAPKDRGGPAPAQPFPGDSETEFTAAELERIVDDVWQHGRVMPEADGAVWRQDACGAWMMREHFGRADSEFGWKIERVAVESEGKPGLLRPFHWRNDFDVANRRPHCGITADRSHVPAERQAVPPRNKRP